MERKANDDYGNSKSNRIELKRLLIIIKISFPDHVSPTHIDQGSYIFSFPLPVETEPDAHPFRFVW